MRAPFFLLIFIIPAAQAQDASQADIQYRKVTEINIETVSLSADAVKPELTAIAESRRPEFHSLFRFRTDFRKEMKETVLEVQ